MWYKDGAVAKPVVGFWYKDNLTTKPVIAAHFKNNDGTISKFWPKGSGGGGVVDPSNLVWESRALPSHGSWRVGGSESHGFMLVNPNNGQTAHTETGDLPLTTSNLPGAGAWSKPALITTYGAKWSWVSVQAGSNKAAYSHSSPSRWMSANLPFEGGWTGVSSLEGKYELNMAFMYDSWVPNPETGGTQHNQGAKCSDIGSVWTSIIMPSKQYWVAASSFQDDTYWGMVIVTGDGGAAAVRDSSTGNLGSGWSQIANIYSDGLNSINAGAVALGKRKSSRVTNGETIVYTSYYAIAVDTSITTNKSTLATYVMDVGPGGPVNMTWRWVPRQLPVPGRWVGVAYGGGYWVFIEYGSGRCLISHWETFEDMKVVQMPNVAEWYDIAYCKNANAFIATALNSSTYAVLKLPASS